MTDKINLVRKATEEDSRRIWAIRNHPICRQNFHDQKEIDFKHHKVWFKEQYFNKSDNRCYVLEKDSKVIGYCRFDLKNSSYLISIAIDPVYQGLGLGSQLLGKASKKLKTVRDILAEVQRINPASIKIFEQNNFERYKEDKEYYYYKLKK